MVYIIWILENHCKKKLLGECVEMWGNLEDFCPYFAYIILKICLQMLFPIPLHITVCIKENIVLDLDYEACKPKEKTRYSF